MRPVFEALGRAILEAQVLESILVRQNLIHDAETETLDKQEVERRFAKLNEATLGSLLRTWSKKSPKHTTPFEYLQQVREDRNYLAHHFFRDNKGDTEDLMLSRIHEIEQRLRQAQMLIYAFDPNMRRELDAEWGITEDDRKA